MILILWNWWYYCDSLAVFLQYLGWMSFSYHLAIPKGLLVLVLVIAENFHYILWICSYNKPWYCLHYRQVTIIILQDVFYSNIPTLHSDVLSGCLILSGLKKKWRRADIFTWQNQNAHDPLTVYYGISFYMA